MEEEDEAVNDAPIDAAAEARGGAAGFAGGTSSFAGGAMPTPTGGRFDISKLLDALMKYNGADLHIRVNRPPCIRVRGELRNLGTTVLTPDDTTSLMKSITGERNQTELGEKGGSDYGFAYGDAARFRVSIFK